jgi:60 kDa SS-A/Ro ribonucleoprotein
MVNINLFASFRGILSSRANSRNEAGGVAYKKTPKQALAQIVSTGCFNDTFYAKGGEQMDKVLGLCLEVEPEFIAGAALYSRQKATMKDMPAFLCAVLSIRSPGLLAEIFDRVINNQKMLRNFIQIMRSGAVGRKSLGTLPKRLIQQWLEKRSAEQLFLGSVGQSPSLGDILRMVHPKPATKQREAFYGYLLGKPHDTGDLPGLVRSFEGFSNAPERESLSVPNVPFEMLTSLELTNSQWAQIASSASWQTTRMNLNTFMRHQVFDDPQMVDLIAGRLRDRDLIAKAKPLPYQLMMALKNTGESLPEPIVRALHDAMEISVSSVPSLSGRVFVFPDVSGSMQSPVTGRRKGSTSSARCINVAALVAAAILRQNPTAEIIPFENEVVQVQLDPMDSIFTNGDKLAAVGGGGTNCSAPLVHLNKRKAMGDLVVYVSDNQSWVDTRIQAGVTPTETMKQWQIFKKRNPIARMVCIDLQPYTTTQAEERADIIHVGGFSDQLFTLLADVASGGAEMDHWVKTIEGISI